MALFKAKGRILYLSFLNFMTFLLGPCLQILKISLSGNTRIHISTVLSFCVTLKLAAAASQFVIQRGTELESVGLCIHPQHPLVPNHTWNQETIPLEFAGSISFSFILQSPHAVSVFSIWLQGYKGRLFQKFC